MCMDLFSVICLKEQHVVAGWYNIENEYNVVVGWCNSFGWVKQRVDVVAGWYNIHSNPWAVAEDPIGLISGD